MPASYYRQVAKLLSDAGWTMKRQGKGRHEIWVGPDGAKVCCRQT